MVNLSGLFYRFYSEIRLFVKYSDKFILNVKFVFVYVSVIFQLGNILYLLKTYTNDYNLDLQKEKTRDSFTPGKVILLLQ